MKKTIIITGSIVAAFILLYVFNRLTTKTTVSNFFTEVQGGEFEISLSAAGELVAEKSLDIQGPELAGGRDIRSTNIKIQDLIPEGTMVNKGDYIATLDRTELNNNLKDALEQLATRYSSLEMKLLDTAIAQNGLRDDIRNQTFIVKEAEITLRNSKYESPSVIRQAEISFDKAKRTLEQYQRNYTRQLLKSKTDISNQNYWISRIQRRVDDLQEVLAGFTITAPSSGMVMYKKEWRGTKRKVGSTISPMDRVVATLPDLSTMVSKTFINEIDISKIKTGQKVNISLDAFPGKSYSGIVTSVANIGEELPNTTEKVFEVLIKLDYVDPTLRPSMTTSNKIILKTVPDAVFVPIECVQAGADSIPFVYTKSGTKQIIILAGTNDKYIRVEEGLKPGTTIYLNNPEKPEKFKLTGEEFIPVIRDRAKAKQIELNSYKNQALITQ